MKRPKLFFKMTKMMDSGEPGMSMIEGKEQLADWLEEIKPQRVLDVGAGLGMYGELVKIVVNWPIVSDAIEIWAPYIEKYQLGKIYDNVFNVDVREYADFDYDLVILGDVLEHMSKEDAIAVYNRAYAQAKYVFISIPTIHAPQGGYENPYEDHVVDDWTVDEVLKSFNGIDRHETYGMCSSFYVKTMNVVE